MRAITLLLISLALIAAVNCYAFTGVGTVQIGTNTAWPATVRADTASQRVQIDYDFDVRELELYQTQSRYQTCPSSCKNYFLSSPMPDFGYRSGGVVDSSDPSLRRFTAPSNDGYVTTIWTRIATGQLVRVRQTGPNGFSKTYSFSSVSETMPSFAGAPPNCASVQCGQALDLMLVIDSSGSISAEDYIIEMDYAQQVIDSFTIGQYGVHAGLVTFATNALLRSPLTYNKASLTNIINTATQQQGETNIGDAIILASQEFASNARGGNVPKVIILLTDGKANRPEDNPINHMITAANTAKSNGILIYAIGVGSLVQQSDLNDIASAPVDQFTSLVGDFDALQSTISNILRQVCVGGEADGCDPACFSDTQFCGCGTCMCVGSQSSCGLRGTWDSGSCSCSCSSGWAQTSSGRTCMRCTVTSCANGGTIINDPANGICGCDCANNWAGVNCDTCTFDCPGIPVVASCTQGTCRCPSGTHLLLSSGCTVCDPNYCVHGTSINGCTACQCDANWGGARCNDCIWECEHDGQVVDCSSCSCNHPWDGDHCENCQLVCQSGTLDSNTCTCNCPARHTGQTCNACATSGYCRNGGTMQNNYPTCSCNCPAPWGGNDCTTCQLTCASGQLITANGQCRCDCAPGYTGTRCDMCDANYCVRGTQGTAPAGCDDCTCPGNWGGATCNDCLLDEISHIPHCASGTPRSDCTGCVCRTFTDIDGSTVPKTQGTYCDTCFTGLCLNGGTINLASFPDCRCNCPSNFQGRRCNECVNTLCSHDGEPADNTCTSCVCDPEQHWSGTFCTECNIVCQNGGTVNTNTCECECADFWRGEFCELCNNEDPEFCDECSYNGILNEDCTECICDEYHTGETCSECRYTCGPNGERSADCLTCDCRFGYIGETCEICDTSINSVYCNGRGTITNAANGCNICECENFWGTDDCSTCTLDCHGNGRTNDDCTACICDNSWSEEDNCLTCDLDCNGNGVVNEDCTACVCDGGYIGQLCNVCDASNYLPLCVHDVGTLTEDCECDCLDQWTGRYCDDCDLSALNCENGDIVDYEINGEMQCRCRCYNSWIGDQCNYCGFLLEDNPLYQCPGISEPSLTDCSCHCPEYYRDIEGCDECIITNEDCVHEEPGSVPDLTKGVCACICEGNWSGRNCSICDPVEVTCRRGWRLNMDNCECEEICGDGIIVGDEQCEVSLMESVDTVCCQDCFFDERRPCDDLRSCTRFDFCEVHGNEISCDGTENVDYTVDADRRPIPLGPLTSNYWSRWGITVTSTVSINIVDTRTLGYPSTNPCGGDIVFDRVLVAPNAESNARLCFNMDEPIEVQSVSVINNAKEPGASSSFHIEFHCANTVLPIVVDARNYGPGSVEFIRNLCTGYLVTSICYQNFPTGAIGPLFFCDDNNYNLGRLGDYVWYDISVDNIQDANELPVPGVPVKLYEGTYGRFLAITYTNDDGFYIFEYLYNGNYSVEFNAPVGYTYSTPVRYPYTDILHYGALDENYITDTVKEILTVDVGIYLFGAIGDYIFYDVSEDGIQNEASSYAVAGVTLRLYDADDRSTVIDTKVTNSFGNYLFAPLPVYKTATTYHSYVVVMTPPPDSTVTLRFSGSDTTADSNFDRVTFISDVVPLTLQRPYDMTIDGGIYYCCGSVGDRVWYDTEVVNGIQDAGENGVPNVRVTLYRNNVAVGSQLTSSTGYYLFSELPLAGSYHVHFDRVANYVLTEKSKGSNREFDSDANPNGDTDTFYLTREVPHRRDIDAGIKAGCVEDEECTSNDLCVTATCNEAGVCVYTPEVTCDPISDPCSEPVCQPSTGNCVPVPKITTARIPCNDNNECTHNDACDAGQCKGTPSNGPGFRCDDEDTCTSDDHCVEGECVGTPCSENPDPCITTICDATGCRDVPSPLNTPCNDDNLCTNNDVCDGNGRCAGSPRVCENNEYCKEYTCDRGTGRCVPTITPGEDCSDGSPCTSGDRCDARGTCVGTPITCSGTNPCLNYFCQGGTCTTSVKSSTTPCNDNNECTENDRCQPDATCAGTPKTCDDGKVCTTDTCEAGSCVHRVAPDATCSDSNTCTTDICDDRTGECISTPIECDDGKPCTIDQCVNGQCYYYPTTSPCNDNDPCTIFDVCDPEGNCSGVAKTCDDGNLCTDDQCNPITGACEHTNNNLPCDDATECSGTSYCADGECVGYDVVNCVSTNPCTIATCDDAIGSCTEEAKPDGTICQTDDLCRLNGVCEQGECRGIETVCNDNNPCTVDSCVDGECRYTHTVDTNGIPCNDGNRCTQQDVCIYDAAFALSRCYGTPMHCDDGNVCTHDFCNILTGECATENTDSTVTCTDNDNCTLDDVCVEGECTGTPRLCTPSAVCRESVCDAATGECVETITEGETCNDGQVCTSDDTCDAEGNCVGEPRCTDVHPNPCKDIICSDEGECIIVNVIDDTPCDDGNACTRNSVCVLGRCTGLEPVSCPNDDVCNRRECVDIDGVPTCETTFTQESCGESTECHDFICSQGSCQTIINRDCNAGNTNACTRRYCSDAGTCVEEDVTGPCEDGNPCTINECEDGECVVTETIEPCGVECTSDDHCPTASNCFHYNCINDECVLSADSCTPSTNPCIRVACDPATGVCVPQKLVNTRCNDDNRCTTNDICVSTGSGAEDVECVGSDIPCPTLTCKEGTCNPENGECTYRITDGATCDDSNLCTEDDVCDPEANCRGTPISCDDGNICTDDECVEGQCVRTDNTRTCNDGNACTSNDRCIEKLCVGQTETTCPESTDPCKRYICDRINGCVLIAVEDGIVCGDNNEDLCLDGDSVCRGGVCVPPPRVTCPASEDPQCPLVCIDNECRVAESTDCSDDDPCTVQDRCRPNGECVGIRLDCSYLNNGCVEGVCFNGACVERPVSGDVECDDNDLCTNNYCEDGVCRSTPVTCSSNDPCDLWSCDPARGCVASNNPVSCTPTGLYDRCLDHICIDRVCTAVPPTRVCDDNNPCTLDQCYPLTGECVHIENDRLLCSDGNACTNDACIAGECVSTPIVCEDNNVCTSDECIGGICVHNAVNDINCEFSVGCITGGICANKECRAHFTSRCDDVNVDQCQTVYCELSTGNCITSTITDGQTTCDDSNPCTTGDVCTPQGCQGTPIVCDPSAVECRESVCEGGVCILQNNDNLECHSQDTSCTTSICVNGVCEPNPEGFVDCSDDDNCTYGNVCGTEGCESTAFSCILSPCIYSSCTNDGFCRYDDSISTWNPLTYIAFRTTTNTEPSEIRFYIVAISSLTGELRGFVRVSDSVISLQVKPYEGGLYAVLSNATASTYLYRIPVNPTAVNVLADGVQTGWTFISRISTSAVGTPDLSFKPTFVASDQPHTYSLWARSRQNARAFSLNTATNPATPAQQFGNTFNGWRGFTWDNHGRFIYGTNTDRQLLLFNHKEYDTTNPTPGQGVYELCNGDQLIPTGTFIDMFTRYDESIVGATDDRVNQDLNIFSIRFDVDANGNPICLTSIASLNKTGFADPLFPESVIEVQAIAFDDTICLTAVGGPNSDGGNVTHTGGGGAPGSSNGGGNNPPPVTAPPPDQVVHYQGGSTPGAHAPGTTDNNVLTGGTGSIATAVVGVIGTSAVAAFAVFAVVLGLNNTKKDPPPNLTAALVSTDVSAIASDNPLFQGLNEAGTNVLA